MPSREYMVLVVVLMPLLHPLVISPKELQPRLLNVVQKILGLPYPKFPGHPVIG
jgi:hypothetical protein